MTGEGIDTLAAAIEARLAAGRVLIELELDPADGAGVSWLHRHTEVHRTRRCDDDGRLAMTVRAIAGEGGRRCGRSSMPPPCRLTGSLLRRLGLVPQPIHFGERRVLPASCRVLPVPLDGRKPALEFSIGLRAARLPDRRADDAQD